MTFTSDMVIGLEIHVELDTHTKLFCGCPTKGNEEPNTRVCPTCLGHPGSKPVVNAKAVEFGLKLAMALQCKIAPSLIFSRKSYFYPDLAKNYQITQYEEPLGEEGVLAIDGKKIGITRVHLEEDPASLVHEKSSVLIDYNRSGNPLVEIVTKPELHSAEEARDFMKKLLSILNYLGIFDEAGIIKADANVSLKEGKYVRHEIKNITGFKEIERALHYEIQRQQMELESGHKLRQETRGWNPERGITYPMRIKEVEEEYGYIIDPDLVGIDITDEMKQKAEESLPELAGEKIKKFTDMGIDKGDAEVLAQDRLMAELFERVSKKVDKVLAARWIRLELGRVLNYHKKTVADEIVDEEQFIVLLRLLQDGKITNRVGQKLMDTLAEKSFDVAKRVKKERLEVVSDTKALEKICKAVVDGNKKAVEDYLKGEQKSFQFLVGQVMAKTKGQVNPQEINRILKKLVK